MLVYLCGIAVAVVTTVLLTVVTMRQVRKPATATASHDADCEVLIVGSGVMGSALAAVLARDGRRVTVIERSLCTPDRIVGEVLQPGGLQALRELGLEDCLKRIDAHFYDRSVITDELRGVQVNLPFGEGVKAVAFHHGKFVTALREKAQAEENCTYIEGNVLEVVEEDGIVRGVRYKPKGSEKSQELRAQLTFICDGAFSRLRKANVSVAPVRLGVGVAMEYEGMLRDGTHGEIFMTPNNSLHTYRFGPNVTRFFVNVRGPMPDDIKQFYKRLCQSLPDEMRERVLASIDKNPIRSVPTYHLPEAASVRPGVLTMGDALNIRHPVTGSGMTVIFKDIIMMRELLKDIPDLNDVEAIERVQKTFMSRRKSYTFVINVFARCFFDIAFPPNDAWMCIRSAAVDYMGLGGRAKTDLIALLANTDTRPVTLFYHLTIMTFFMAYQCVKQERWRMMPRGVLRALSNTGHIAVMAVPLLWSEI